MEVLGFVLGSAKRSWSWLPPDDQPWQLELPNGSLIAGTKVILQMGIFQLATFDYQRDKGSSKNPVPSQLSNPHLQIRGFLKWGVSANHPANHPKLYTYNHDFGIETETYGDLGITHRTPQILFLP